MPIGINSKRRRSAALPSRSPGYHFSGVAILRPSARVTTSSTAVMGLKIRRRQTAGASEEVLLVRHYACLIPRLAVVKRP